MRVLSDISLYGEMNQRMAADVENVNFESSKSLGLCDICHGLAGSANNFYKGRQGFSNRRMF